MLSMAQFGGEMADDHIGRLIAEAESSRPARRPAEGSPRIAEVLRSIADRIDPAGSQAFSDPSSDPC
jgi:hypothetical protein